MLERIAHAKINLALHVVGQRSDGYHLLDSLVAFTQLGDVICVNEATDASSLVSLTIDGPFSKGLDASSSNLVSRAALALGPQVTEKYGKPKSVEIKLTKNLPISSGIGGGSADAAATLLTLQKFWKSDINLENIALELGADVPMCLYSKPLRAQGVGDEISLLKSKAPFHIVLVNSGIEVSTPEIFKKLTEKNNLVIGHSPINKVPSFHELKEMRNDLQKHAVEIEPTIQDVLSVISETNPELTRMSGSGATCFAIYKNQQLAEEAANKINLNHPKWWCVATTTIVS